MKHMKHWLWDEVPFKIENGEEDQPYLIPYFVEERERTSVVIVCPGGGYAHRAEHEGEPVAKWLNSLGISAFVLHYRVHPYRHPVPLLDAKRAVRTVRFYANDWHIDPDRIGILGFSAGGHLASSVGTHFDAGNSQDTDPVERHSSRPDALILCYPVISMFEHRHQGSMEALLGKNPNNVQKTLLSSERQVRANTPPTFIWHTADDDVVPVENSILFAEALRKHEVPFAMHIVESGRHGLGLAQDHPYAAVWTSLCAGWLKQHQF